VERGRAHLSRRHPRGQRGVDAPTT
jgi:hypothetical protein